MHHLRAKVFGLLVILFISFLSMPHRAEAGIVLKVVAANPSKAQSQQVSVKAYLPKEAKPEDVMDRGDLEIAYDTQQGSYFVYGDYTLKPGETIERDIELRDIWMILESDIESLRSEANKLSDALKNTEFSDRIAFLRNNIESKLNQIVENQKGSPPNPERHISDYRENIKTLDSVKADLALARILLSQAKPLPTVVIWRLIIAIIVFLGLLGLSFYFIWQKQVKVITQDTFYVPPEKPESSSQVKPTQHEAEGEKELEPGEIEKLLGEEKQKKEGT